MEATLFDAIRQGDAAEVRRLLDSDPQLAGARNADGATAVLWAAYTRHSEIAPLLLASRDPDFFEACALGRRERVEGMLRADPALARGFSADGFSALGLAIFFGHAEIARLLVAGGADVNAPSRNAFRVAPLHSAVASGDLQLVELLLENGALPESEEFLEATPLHSAAAHGNLPMVEKLLAAGANPGRRTKDGKTAAELARQHGHEAVSVRLER
jgi:uncharacterized protein